MPVERTPPRDATITKSIEDLSSRNYDSEPNREATSSERATNVTKRVNKRLRRGSSDKSPVLQTNDSLKSMISSQDTKLEIMMNFMKEIKDQICDVQKSVEFMSLKYDDLLEQFNSLEEERKADRKRILQLENKIESLERNSRVACIELINIPIKKNESKNDLLKTIQNAGNILNIPIQKYDVKNIYRVNTTNQAYKPIVTEFSSVFMKDEVMSALKQFNTTNKENKLNTVHLSLDGPKKPVYISESLTFKNKKLYAMARELAKSQNYTFCWVSRGLVYLRKKEGSPAIRINEEADIIKLNTNV